jgi:8-oxo-dGTP pyrophosphatase MutT (NUDIX family)
MSSHRKNIRDHSRIKKSTAAGFIVVSSDFEKIIVLRKKNGDGDLPKGKKEKDENSLYCAIRETAEETGIELTKDSIKTRTPFCCESIDFFIAVQDGDPYVSPNPQTGNFEHVWVGWLPWIDAMQIVRNYLRPAINHAMKVSKALKES